MQNLFSFLFALCLVCAISCKNESKVAEATAKTVTEQTEEKVADESGLEYTSNYICPMHCPGSGSDTTGVCPTCDMDYVINDKKDDHKGHDHDDHEGHDH